MVEENPEKRRHPRQKLDGLIKVTDGEWTETLVLPAENVSLGGIWLSTAQSDQSRLKLGERYELLLVDEGRAPIRLSAKVARHDGEGTAFEWSEEDPHTRSLVEQLIKTTE